MAPAPKIDSSPPGKTPDTATASVGSKDKNAKPDPNADTAGASQDVVMQRFDGNPQFTKLKNAVLALLQ